MGCRNGRLKCGNWFKQNLHPSIRKSSVFILRKWLRYNYAADCKKTIKVDIEDSKHYKYKYIYTNINQYACKLMQEST